MKLFSTSILAATVLAVSSMASADDREFEAFLSGAQEMPSANTPAIGRITAKFDRAFTSVTVDLKVINLVGTFAAAHFHCNRPGANGPVAFGLVNPGPLTFDGRRIRGTLTNANFTGADCTGPTGRPVNNIAALAFAMRDGLVYANVHTNVFPGGEIRGQMLEADEDDED
ncbi:MAG: CHRD domain-containing protein [Steroidobacteraceae bacterium]